MVVYFLVSSSTIYLAVEAQKELHHLDSQRSYYPVGVRRLLRIPEVKENMRLNSKYSTLLCGTDDKFRRRTRSMITRLDQRQGHKGKKCAETLRG